jgi:predicted peroxiredoxin
MKRTFFFLSILSISLITFAQKTGKGENTNSTTEKKAMKIGIVICSNDPETVWNAFRLANFSLAEGDSVFIFLSGKGVEAPTISSKDFDVKEKMDDFSSSGGKIFACGTCLRQRNQEGSKLCPVSSLSDLYDIIKKSEKILTF